jgi:hypothetical protein
MAGDTPGVKCTAHKTFCGSGSCQRTAQHLPSWADAVATRTQSPGDSTCGCWSCLDCLAMQCAQRYNAPNDSNITSSHMNCDHLSSACIERRAHTVSHIARHLGPALLHLLCAACTVRSSLGCSCNALACFPSNPQPPFPATTPPPTAVAPYTRLSPSRPRQAAESAPAAARHATTVNTIGCWGCSSCIEPSSSQQRSQHRGCAAVPDGSAAVPDEPLMLRLRAMWCAAPESSLLAHVCPRRRPPPPLQGCKGIPLLLFAVCASCRHPLLASSVPCFPCSLVPLLVTLAAALPLLHLLRPSHPSPPPWSIPRKISRCISPFNTHPAPTPPPAAPSRISPTRSLAPGRSMSHLQAILGQLVCVCCCHHHITSDGCVHNLAGDVLVAEAHLRQQRIKQATAATAGEGQLLTRGQCAWLRRAEPCNADRTWQSNERGFS